MVQIVKYGKGIGSLLATLTVLWIAAASDGAVSGAEWWSLAGSGLATVAVVGIPNTLESPAVKQSAQVLAVIVSGIGLAVTQGDPVTGSLVATLLVQAASIVGVYVIPNTGDRYSRELAAVARTS